MRKLVLVLACMAFPTLAAAGHGQEARAASQSGAAHVSTSPEHASGHPHAAFDPVRDDVEHKRRTGNHPGARNRDASDPNSPKIADDTGSTATESGMTSRSLIHDDGAGTPDKHRVVRPEEP